MGTWTKLWSCGANSHIMLVPCSWSAAELTLLFQYLLGKLGHDVGFRIEVKVDGWGGWRHSGRGKPALKMKWGHFALGVDELFSIYYLIPLQDNKMYRRRDIPPLFISTSLFHEAESREYPRQEQGTAHRARNGAHFSLFYCLGILACIFKSRESGLKLCLVLKEAVCSLGFTTYVTFTNLIKKM